MVGLEDLLETFLYSEKNMKIRIKKGIHGNEDIYEGNLCDLDFATLKKYGYFIVVRSYIAIDGTLVLGI